MPYNSETETFYQAPATVVDSTPDGDTVQEGFDDRLTPALAGVYADFNLLKADGMISVGIPATTTARGIGRIATSADAAVGSTITNGPAFLDAATWKLSATPAAGIIPLADANGKLASWVDPVAAITGSFKNLKANASGTSVNISVTVDELVVKNSSNVYLTLRDLSLTWTSAGVGVANGIDTGSITANTWYYVHVIHNPTTSATALLISLSATAPTLPSGYTYWARIGSLRWGASYPLGFTQADRWIWPKVASGSNVTALPCPISGVQGSLATPTWVAASLSSIVPSTAVAVHVVIPAVGGGGAVAPNNSYGGGASPTNPPPIAAMVAGAGASGIIPLETMNIYYAADNANRGAFIAGWEDNL